MLSVFLGVVTPAPHLVEGAAYGKLPFDRFVLVMSTPNFSYEKFPYRDL